MITRRILCLRRTQYRLNAERLVHSLEFLSLVLFVYERVRILVVKVYERVGSCVISVREKAQKDKLVCYSSISSRECIYSSNMKGSKVLNKVCEMGNICQ